jgi:hypothetical protein
MWGARIKGRKKDENGKEKGRQRKEKGKMESKGVKLMQNWGINSKDK